MDDEESVGGVGSTRIVPRHPQTLRYAQGNINIILLRKATIIQLSL